MNEAKAAAESAGVSVILNLGGCEGKGSTWNEPDAETARWVAEKIAEAILAAVEAEREECAKAAEGAEEQFVDDDDGLKAQRRECARAIRVRG